MKERNMKLVVCQERFVLASNHLQGSAEEGTRGAASQDHYDFFHDHVGRQVQTKAVHGSVRGGGV